MHESAAFDGADSCPGTMQDRPGPWCLLRKTVNEGDILQVGPRNEIVRENRRAIENHGSDVREDLCVLLDWLGGAGQDE